MKDMKQVGNVWVPAHETHMAEWMKKRNVWVDGKLTYQYHKLQAAMPFVKKHDCAVDVGAHVGFWSMHLAKQFKTLHSFEPVALHRDCYIRNVEMHAGVQLHAKCLGDKPGSVAMHTTQGSSGDTWVDPSVQTGDIPMITLDSLNLPVVDFMKIDCEGFELFVLRGAEETLRRCKPVVVVEQKHTFANKYGVGAQDALPFLKGLGATLRKEWSGDFIFSWE
jgi:FkbM family methyltransferase